MLQDDHNYDADTNERPFRSKQSSKLIFRKKKTPKIRVAKPNSSLVKHTESNMKHTDSRNPIIDDASGNQSRSSCTESTNGVEDTIERQVKNLELFKLNDMSALQIAQMQSSDVKLRPIINYLKHGTLPSSSKDAKFIILQSKDYFVVNSILFHTRQPKCQRTKNLQHNQLVLPRALVKQVIQLYHDSPMGGHGGIQDTTDRIREHYYCHKLAQYVTDYVKSCPDCQKRKTTKAHTKSGIVAFPAPSGPFEVWQVDLYGPLPLSSQGNNIVFTAVDMFSKYLFTVPIANSDAATVSLALFQLFTTFGTCQTLISDRGTEFTSKVTQEICRLLDVPQQFTPSFVHHCLGACERTHLTLAERMTPYMSPDKRNWQDVLPAIVFSMNNTVNSTLGYSPFEVIYAKRPHFPLSSHIPETCFTTIPNNMHSYIKQHIKSLNVIREQVKQNAVQAQTKMVMRANANENPLFLQKGDYVYLLSEPIGKGRKLTNRYTGPFVVHELLTPHMVTLINPETGRKQKSPVHLDRLKMAFVREPNPVPYFVDRVVTKINDPKTESEGTLQENLLSSQHSSEGNISDPISTLEQDQSPLRRSDRVTKPVQRYGNPVVGDSDSNSVQSDIRGYCKIKRVLGQRQTSSGQTQYLVHIDGEPSQKAVWVDKHHLDRDALKAIALRPPQTVP